MKSSTISVLRVYWSDTRRYKPLLFFTLACVFAVGLANLAIPVFYKKFFDAISQSAASPEQAKRIFPILLVILGINGIIWIGYRGGGWATALLQSRVMTDLRQRAFDYLLGHSYGFFTENFSGSLVQKVGRLSRSFTQFSDRLLWDILPLAIRIVGVTVVLWLFNHTVALIMAGWTLSFLGVNFALSVWKMKYNIRKAAEDSRTTAALADAIGNQSTIQSFGGFSFESARFHGVIEELRKITIFTWNLEVTIEGVQGLFAFAAEFLLFTYMLKNWGLGLTTIGMFVMIQSYLIQLIGRLWDFGRMIRSVYESFADAQEMVEILEKPYQIQDAPGVHPLIVGKGRIEFRGVEFLFHETRPVLKNIRLTIEPGEKIALVGPSGAGKSTFVKLLLRLYDVSAGSILIDGQDIRRVTQESVRNAIGLVPQDPILFHRTLMENIRYGKRDASDEDVRRVAKLSHCDEFIDDLPLRYETLVGERGVKLSGGERQRVAIARAMLKNAPILVLDEATSSLDSQSETLIQDALEELMKNRTTIVIAHRLSTIRRMDRIVVIDKGEIVEEGTHETLMREKESLYRTLWRLQAGGFLHHSFI